MKIAHICISAPYIDGWGYQENLLPKALTKEGAENHVVAPIDNFPAYLGNEEVQTIQERGTCYMYDGVTIHRISTRKYTSSLLVTKGLMKTLEEIQPDMLFHHNVNCTSMVVACRYAKRYRVPLVVDNHADVINMSKNRLWAFVYYMCLNRLTCLVFHKQIAKAYGVTHSRCEFFHNYYGVPHEKIELLPIGADEEMSKDISDKASLREKYHFSQGTFVVTSGGKMSKDKGTDRLIEAVKALSSLGKDICLVLFGKYEDDETKILAEKSECVQNFGWCDHAKTLELLKLADLACWPIHHTTLIEDAVAVATPLLLWKTSTTEHLVDGNGIWLNDNSTEGITDALTLLMERNETDKMNMANACIIMKKRISYTTISQQVLKTIDTYGS